MNEFNAPQGRPADTSGWAALADPLEQIRAAYRAESLQGRGLFSTGYDRATQEAYDEVIDEVHRITGRRFNNPAEAFTGSPANEGRSRQPFALGEVPGVNDPTAEFETLVGELATNQPLSVQTRLRTIASRAYIDRRAKELTKEAVTRSEAITDQRGIGAIPAQFIGTAGAMATDPYKAATLFLGAADRARTLLGAVGREATANAIGQAAVEPQILAGRQEMGLDAGLDVALGDIALAAVIGGAFPLVGAGGKRAAEFLSRSKIDKKVIEADARLRELFSAIQTRDPEAIDVAKRAFDIADQELATLEAQANVGLGVDPDAVRDLQSTDELIRELEVISSGGRAIPEADPRLVEEEARVSDESPSPDATTILGKTVGRARFDPERVIAQPDVFQYKRVDGSADGLNEDRRGTAQWDQTSADNVFVYEYTDGTQAIVDGHRRLFLAKNAIAAGTAPRPYLDGFLYREADGWTTDEVRALAARKNMRAGTGDVLDAADIIRTTPGILDKSIDVTAAHIVDATAIARLEENAYRMTRSGRLPPQFAAIIGRVARDAPEAHMAIAEAMVKLRPANKLEAEALAYQGMALRQFGAASEQLTLFGDDVTATNMSAQMRVLGLAANALKDDRRVFGVLARNAGQIERAGNVLATDANKRQAQIAAIALKEMMALANTRGPVNDALLFRMKEHLTGATSDRQAADAFVNDYIRLLEDHGLLALKTAPSALPPVIPSQVVEPAQAIAAAGDAAVLGEPGLFDAPAAPDLAVTAETQIARQLELAGGYAPEDAALSASILAAAYRSLGARFGMSAEELLRVRPVVVQAGAAAGGDLLQPGPDGRVSPEEMAAFRAEMKANVVNDNRTDDLQSLNPSLPPPPPPPPRPRPTLVRNQAERGSITLPANWSENTAAVIRLAKAADKSTFFHESGHLLLQLMGEMAARSDAPPELRADWDKVLAYLGAKTADDIGVPQHEVFARSFEAYLMEGNAPTPELQGAFAKIKQWFVEIYRTLRGLNVQLTPEIRGVFDRALGGEVSPAPAKSAPSDSSFAERFRGVSSREEMNAAMADFSALPASEQILVAQGMFGGTFRTGKAARQAVQNEYETGVQRARKQAEIDRLTAPRPAGDDLTLNQASIHDIIAKMPEQDRRRLEATRARLVEDAKTTGRSQADIDAELTNIVKHMLAQKKRATDLQVRAQNRLAAGARQFVNRKGESDVGEFAIETLDQIQFRSRALANVFHSELGALLQEFAPGAIGGFRGNTTRMELMVREIFGDDTGDATAKALAQAWQRASERLRVMFNDAGGNIEKLDTWRLPQMHSPITVGSVAASEWKAFIKPLLDRERMRSEITGRPFSDRELDEALDDAWRNITFHGQSLPGMELGSTSEPGRGGPMWRRRSDPRFLAFKDADSWLTYNRRFGNGENAMDTLLTYVNRMAFDITSMQVLGPDADATIRWLAGSEGNPAGAIVGEAIRKATGQEALFPDRDDIGRRFKNPNEMRQYAVNKSKAVQDIWDYLAGYTMAPVNPKVALLVSSFKNVVSSTALGQTVFLTGSDLVNQAITRYMTGFGVKDLADDLVRAIGRSLDREELLALGAEIDSAVSVMGAETRDLGVLHGAAWTRWLADRNMQWTLLKPITQAQRVAWSMGSWRQLYRLKDTAYAALPARTRREMARFGIGADEWAFVAAAQPYSRNGYTTIRPGDVAAVSLPGSGVQARPGLTQGEEVSLRLRTFIQAGQERSVISGAARSQRFFAETPGTAKGSLVSLFAQLKAYSFAWFLRHGNAMAEIYWRNGGKLQGSLAASGYAAAAVMPAMFLVALGMQIQELANGRDPRDISDVRFWQEAGDKTVSLGAWTDIAAAASQPPDDFRTMALGPGIGRILAWSAVGQSAGAEIGAALSGEPLDESQRTTGRKFVAALRQSVPLTGMWFWRLGWDRLFYDQIQKLVDPNVDESFRRRARWYERERGQEYWWEPGEPLPTRAPDMEAYDFSDEDADRFAREPAVR